MSAMKKHQNGWKMQWWLQMRKDGITSAELTWWFGAVPHGRWPQCDVFPIYGGVAEIKDINPWRMDLVQSIPRTQALCTSPEQVQGKTSSIHLASSCITVTHCFQALQTHIKHWQLLTSIVKVSKHYSQPLPQSLNPGRIWWATARKLLNSFWSWLGSGISTDLHILADSSRIGKKNMLSCCWAVRLLDT